MNNAATQRDSEYEVRVADQIISAGNAGEIGTIFGMLTGRTVSSYPGGQKTFDGYLEYVSRLAGVTVARGMTLTLTSPEKKELLSSSIGAELAVESEPH